MSVTRPFDFLIQWHLTEKCNLRCSHCYQESKHPGEMPFSDIVEIMESAANMVEDWRQAYGLDFAPSFNVTGGEPFLRQDFFAVLERMRATGFEVYILSNGTLVDAGQARRVAGLGVHGVQVSLEGPEEVHDRIRGSGSFAAAVSGIWHLLDAGVPVSVNATLSRTNAPYFPDLVDLVAGLGVPRLGFSRLVPSGRGAGMLEQMLSAAEVKELYEKIFSLQKNGLKITFGDPVASQMAGPAPKGDEGDIAAGGCAAGISGLTILPDGGVTPCRRLPLLLGNVRRQSLRELWAVSPVLEALRNRSLYRGRCGECQRWAGCRGCRAIAYAWSRSRGRADYLGPDPQCFLD